MHDIDRTATEFESEHEMEAWDGGEFEYEEQESDEEEMGVFDEAEEMDLAAELLSVSDDAELEQFLGKLIKRAGRAARRIVRSPTGRALGGILKGAAKKAVPVVGRVLGTVAGGPAGGAAGSRLASSAGRVFGLELEGLSPEDQEFEVARRFVRFSGEAAKNAAEVPPDVDPGTAAKAATVAAARKHAPGLVRPRPGATTGEQGSGRSGRWVRRGRKIVLLNV
jgi:uncharacterized protein (DUF697 family)